MRRRLSLVLLAGALFGTAGLAQEPAGPSELEEALGRPRRVPAISAELRAMFREVGRDRLVVRGLNGNDIAINIREYEPEDFRRFGDGRFVGFSFSGYEFYGYSLVDRAMAGEAAMIETGEMPAFSPDGRHFAAVQFSGSGWGNLEGLGLWEIRPDGAVQLFFTDDLPEGEDWRIDGWPREDCVRLSAVAATWRPPEGQERDLPTAPRTHFGVEVGEPIQLLASHDQPACGVVDATQP